MTLSSEERADFRAQLNDRDKYILERQSSDRKLHALQFQNLDSKLDKVLDELKPVGNSWFIKIDKNKVLKILYWSVFIFTFWQQINLVANKQAEKQGLEIKQTKDKS